MKINTRNPYVKPSITTISSRAIVEAARLVTKYNPYITRETIERQELHFLSPYAKPSVKSLGRVHPEKEDIRTVFARDCDRILHVRAYEAEGGKTQVFTFPKSPHIHNRRFHSDKVNRVALTIGRYLALNLDLIAAIAMGHDLGHSTFGHDGERALSAISQKVLGRPFKHNLHSLRIVDVLERLNLTFEVRDGIVRHCGETLDPVLAPDKIPEDLVNLDDQGFPRTLEGCVVRISDQIAYLPHDYKDALRLKIVSEADLPKIVKEVFGVAFSGMIDVMIRDVIEASRGKNYITMSDKVLEGRDALFHFEMEKIVGSERVKYARDRIPIIIEALFAHYTEKRKLDPQTAIDKIASLTDQQAIVAYNKIKRKMAAK